MLSCYGGVQMDADHDINYAEVTEMSQMISALMQEYAALDAECTTVLRDAIRRLNLSARAYTVLSR